MSQNVHLNGQLRITQDWQRDWRNACRITSSQPRGHPPATWLRTTVPAMREEGAVIVLAGEEGVTESAASTDRGGVLALSVTGLVSSPRPAWAGPPHTTLVTLAPTGPFSSGQLVDVTVAPNRILEPGDLPHHRGVRRPKQSLAPLAACLRPPHPTSTVGSPPIGTAPCCIRATRSTPCPSPSPSRVGTPPAGVRLDPCLRTGDQRGPARGRWRSRRRRWRWRRWGGMVWSLPFFVAPPGADPPPNTPEVPYVLALPLAGHGHHRRKRLGATSQVEVAASEAVTRPRRVTVG